MSGMTFRDELIPSVESSASNENEMELQRMASFVRGPPQRLVSAPQVNTDLQAVVDDCLLSLASLASSGISEPSMPPRGDGMSVPTDTGFYGVINDCIEMVVIEKFGMDKWHLVKKRAGMDDIADGAFVFTQKFNMDQTMAILTGITEVLGVTVDQALEVAGEGFVDLWCVRNNYVGMLRSQGKNMREFLGNMDRMHGYMAKAKLPQMCPPCFKVEEIVGEDGFTLHYWSFRAGLAPLAKGIIRAAARMLFDQDLKMEVTDKCEEGGQYYTKFWVTQEGTEKDSGSSDETTSVPLAMVWEGHELPEGTPRYKKSNSVVSDPGPQCTKASSLGFPVGYKETRRMSRGRLSNLLTPLHGVGKTAAKVLGNFSPFPTPRTPSELDGEDTVTRKGKTNTSGTEVGALVFMLKESVSRVSSMEGVDELNQGFTVERLCSLLQMKSDEPITALHALFREPITSMRRCPLAGFPSCDFAVCEYPSVVMHRDVTSRLTRSDGNKQVDWMHPPLADQEQREGVLGVGAAKQMKEIEIRACFLQNIVSLSVLKGIAMTPNPSVFETEECQAIILAAWHKVRFRFLLDFILEVLLIGVLFQWDRTADPFRHGYPVLVTSVFKDFAEEMWGLWVHVQRGWFWAYISKSRLGGWSRISLLTLFCVMNAAGAPLDKQRAVFAVVVLLRWGRLLYMLRAFEAFGPKILPIIYMIYSVGPFFVVLMFYVAAFTHALWALSNKSTAEVITLSYRLGILMDFSLDSEGEDGILEGEHMDTYILAWFYLCSAVLTIFMMNVVIGVLGASYDQEQERAATSFLAARAHICYEFIPRMKRSAKPLRLYNVIRAVNHRAETSQRKCVALMLLTLPTSLLYFIQRAFVCEWRVFDHHGNSDKDHHAPFLWYCKVRDSDTAESLSQAGKNQKAMKMIETVQLRLESKMGCELSRISQSVTDLGKHMIKMEGMMKKQAGSSTVSSQQTAKKPPLTRQATYAMGKRPPSNTNTPTSPSINPLTKAKARIREAFERTPSDMPPVTHPPTVPTRPDGATVPTDKLFYGVINDLVESVVVVKFGREKWHEVKRVAGLEDVEDGDFLPTQQYSSDMTYQILGACTRVLGITTEHALEAVGEGFIDLWCVKYDHIGMLRSQGKNMREFLGNINKIHDFLKQARMPGMSPPCFEVEDSSDGQGFTLRYWSFRPGLASLVIGIVRACGRMLFETDFTIEALESSEADGHYYTRFRVFGAENNVDQFKVASGKPGSPLGGARGRKKSITNPVKSKSPVTAVAPAPLPMPAHALGNMNMPAGAKCPFSGVSF